MNIRAALTTKTRQAAFTLSEGLFGVAIMGVVFVSLYTGMASGFKSIRDSQENLRATQIMLEKFETIRLYNWEQINTPGFVAPEFSAQFAPNENSPGVIYRGRVTIGNAGLTDIYNTDLRTVRIDLTWTSGKLVHNRSFTSYAAKFGIQNYIY